jgi:protein required for attachment to host cells
MRERTRTVALVLFLSHAAALSSAAENGFTSPESRTDRAWLTGPAAIADSGSTRESAAGRELAPMGHMYRACIAVVDASRARLFTYERATDAEGLSERLTEERDLVNPARRLRPVDLFSDSRPGTGRTGDLQYRLDDHRDAHIEQLDAEFSRAIVDQLVELLRSNHAQRLILCASPNMLGELRGVGVDLRRGDLAIDEVARDLVKLTPVQLRDRLTDYGLLPARPPPAGA